MPGNPNPSPSTRFKAGNNANPNGRPPNNGPSVRSLDRLARQYGLDDKMAAVLVRNALGHPGEPAQYEHGKLVKAAIPPTPPDYHWFKLLWEYRNGRVPQLVAIEDVTGKSSEEINSFLYGKSGAKGRKATQADATGDGVSRESSP